MGDTFDDGLTIGALVGGRFEIVDLIAAGGMGRVYRARQRSFGAAGRLVALKVLKPTVQGGPTVQGDSAWKRFELEAAAASRLTCPHTVTVHDFGRTDRGLPYLVMELVDGPSLDAVVAREAPLPALRAVTIVTQVLRGLAEAHAVGILHRDVKPANILLTLGAAGEERAVLADFGIAKDLTQPTGGITDNTGGVGTWLYASPEQIEGGAIDARTDLYAAGLVLYELLTGYPPFRKTSLGALLNSHLNEVPPGVVDVYPQTDAPAEVVSIVAAALAKDPRQRPASATHMRRALEAAMMRTVGTLPGFDVRAPAPLPPAPARRPPTSPGGDPRTRAFTPASVETGAARQRPRPRRWLPLAGAFGVLCGLSVAGLGLYSVLKAPAPPAVAPEAASPPAATPSVDAAPVGAASVGAASVGVVSVGAATPAAVVRPDRPRRPVEPDHPARARALETRVPRFAATRTDVADPERTDRRPLATRVARAPTRVVGKRKPARTTPARPTAPPALPAAAPEPPRPTPAKAAPPKSPGPKKPAPQKPNPVIYVPD